MANQFFLSIIEQLSLVLKPLQESLESPEKFSKLLERHGWLAEPNSFANTFDQISSKFDPPNTGGSSFDKLSILFDQVIGADSESIVEVYPKVLGILQNIIGNIQDLVALSSNPPQDLPFPFNNSQFWQEFPTELIDELLISYFESYQHILFSVLLFLGIIGREKVEINETSTTGRVSYTKAILHYENLKYITRPEELRRRVYGWGTDQFDFELLLSNFKQLLNSFGNLSDLSVPSSQLLENYYDSTNPVLPRLRELRISILGGVNEDNQSPFNVSMLIFPIPRDGDRGGIPVGIVMLPEITGDNIPLDRLGKLFELKIGGGFETIRAMRIEARPEKTKVLFTNPAIDKLDIQAASNQRFTHPRIPIGSENSHNIKIFELGFEISLLGTIEDAEVKIVLNILKAQLVIDNSDISIDSFMKDSFGNKSYTVDFGFSLIYSSKTGLHFGGHSGLEANIPINRTIGVVKIDTLTLGIMSLAQGLDLVASVTGSVKFGPVIISVEKIGLSFMLNHVTANEDKRQKIFGDLFMDFAFRSPAGFGITIDSNGVKGGGFISRKEFEYSGVIELDIRGFSVQALALLDTRDTSFLFAIFSNFRSPIQIGAGWKITKIGGLIGINRTVSHSDIASGIKSGILDSILFPDNVIENAPRILGDLKRVFPANSGQHLIGPAVRIAYGTPTLITGDIALILEFPSPFQLSLIGRLRCRIPDEKHPLVQINLIALGAIDFTNERLGIYGTLYDSKILDFTLSGDMAMAASWGPQEKNFVFSIGGFNPKFNPPSNFPPFNAPPLKRLNLAFSSHVTFECYLALTSNTLQIGARVDALFKKGGATISGFLGFDALVQFNPLYYVVDVAAGFSVKFNGRSLASITFLGFIEGPNPHRIKGSVTFSILWWDISVDVDKTFGDQKPEVIISVNPWPILEEALQQNDSWTAELPTWEVIGVVTKESSVVQEADQIIHPLGKLKVSQRVVPLNHTLTKFGSSDPEENFRFEIISLNNVKSPGLVSTQDYFAPAQFTEYEDSEKLTLNSYGLMDSGVFYASDKKEVASAFDSASSKEIEYETFLLENMANEEGEDAKITPNKDMFSLNTILSQTLILAGAPYRTSVSNSNRLKYQLKYHISESTLVNEKFVIVDEDENMAVVPIFEGELSQSAAINKLADYRKANPQDKRNLNVISSVELGELTA